MYMCQLQKKRKIRRGEKKGGQEKVSLKIHFRNRKRK